MLEPDPFYKPLPKNPNLLVRKREFELVGGKYDKEIGNLQKTINEIENEQLNNIDDIVKQTKLEQQLKKAKQELENYKILSKLDEWQNILDSLEKSNKTQNEKDKIKTRAKQEIENLRKQQESMVEESELQEYPEKIVVQRKRADTVESLEEENTKKPKLIGDEESVIKELEEYFEPIFQQAMEPFWLVIHMIEQDSGKVIYPRYVKDLPMEKRKIPIVYGCKTWPEFKMKNHHLGTAILDVMFKKYSDLKKGIGAKSFPEIISDAFFGLPEKQRPAWVVNFTYNPVFHFLLQSAYFGALELAANELKFSLKDLIYSPHVNFMFAQFVSVKFVKPKSNAYAAGIQGQDMQYRISSGAYTGQQQSKWLMGCKLWFQDVYYKDMEKQKRIDILDHKLSELQIKMQDLTNKNKERTLYLKGEFPSDNIYIYWGTTTDLNIVNDIREDYVNLDENLKIYLDQFVSEIINPMSEIRMTIIKIASEKAAIQTEQDRVLFKK